MFFVRTESFQQFIRLYPVITALAIIHVILFLVTEVIPLPVFQEIRNVMVGSNYLIAVHDEYWRFITPIFIHFTLTHVVFNTFSLILFGPALERMLGKVKFILAYLAMGIIANVFTLYLGEITMLHGGASGAIFGLFGLYFYMAFFRKDLLDHQSKQMIMVIIVFAFVMTFARSGINEYAHIFGMLSGVALGPILLTNAKALHHYY